MAHPLIKKVHTACKLLGNPYMFMARMGSNGLLNWLPDKPFLKIAYRGHTGRKLNLENPQRYTEKLQWLKLYDRNPLHTKLVDKYEIRNYLADKVDESHFVKLYGVYDKYDDIDWDVLPPSFIMKCTQGCGCNYIVKDKTAIDKAEIKLKFKKWMKQNPYYTTREWVYKDVTPRIIIEELLDNNGKEPIDYKFYCFDGSVFCWRTQFYQNGCRYHIYYDMDFNDLRISDSHYNRPPENSLTPPPYFQEMLVIAQNLSKGFKHVRVDFLGIETTFYMGEMTFFDGSGYDNYVPESFDYEMGALIKL